MSLKGYKNRTPFVGFMPSLFSRRKQNTDPWPDTLSNPNAFFIGARKLPADRLRNQDAAAPSALQATIPMCLVSHPGASRGLRSLSHVVELSLFPVLPYLVVTEISSVHSNIDTRGEGLYER